MSHSIHLLIYLYEIPHLPPNRGFDLNALAKQLDQILELLVTVFEAMTKNQPADDVGDNVVEEEVRGEWFTCTNLPGDLMQKWRILCKTLDFCVAALVAFTFVAAENVGAVRELINDDRFK